MSGFTLHGKIRYKLRSLYVLISSTFIVGMSRAVGKALVSGWKWDFEVAMRFWREQMNYAFSPPDIKEAWANICI